MSTFRYQLDVEFSLEKFTICPRSFRPEVQQVIFLSANSVTTVCSFYANLWRHPNEIFRTGNFPLRTFVRDRTKPYFVFGTFKHTKNNKSLDSDFLPSMSLLPHVLFSFSPFFSFDSTLKRIRFVRFDYYDFVARFLFQI